MTIEYALTRSEIVRCYLKSLARSRRLLFTTLAYSAAAGILVLFLRRRPSHPLGEADFLVALMAPVIFLVLMPLSLWLTGKTAKRTLTVTPDDISTKIGAMNERIPWRQIKLIQDCGEFILIARKSGNSFFIPNRAFSGNAQRTEFQDLTTLWHRDWQPVGMRRR